MNYVVAVFSPEGHHFLLTIFGSREIGRIGLRIRTILGGLRDRLSFEPSYIQKAACEDEVDVEIIACLMQRGVGGLLPSAIASELAEYSLRRWDVTRRIQRMNKKLTKELVQKNSGKERASMDTNKLFNRCLGIKEPKSHLSWIHFKRIVNALR